MNLKVIRSRQGFAILVKDKAVLSEVCRLGPEA